VYETVCHRTSELLEAFINQSGTWKEISFQLSEILSERQTMAWNLGNRDCEGFASGV